MGALYAKIADLPLEISEHALESLEQTVPSGWVRKTTLIRLRGGGREGCGEDVIWNDEDHRLLQQESRLDLAGTYTLDEFSRRLDEVDLFPAPPSRADYTLYFRTTATASPGTPTSTPSPTLPRCRSSRYASTSSRRGSGFSPSFCAPTSIAAARE